MNTIEHADKEFELLSKSNIDPKNGLINALKDNSLTVIEPFKAEILALVDAFAKSGQSGASAPFTATAIANAVKHLCLLEPIQPLTGKAEEWGTEADKDQNNRLSSVFRKGKRAVYVDAIIWKTQKDVTWSGIAYYHGKPYSSKQYIKSFPFIPKTFIVNVQEMDLGHGNWDLQISDMDELNKVFKYYDEYPIERNT